MISCLDGAVGILDVPGYSTSTFNLYINDLPGITTHQLEKIMDDVEDYQDSANAWDKIYTRAKMNFEGDVRKRMRRYMKNEGTFSNVVTGQVWDENLIGASTELRGFYFEFPVQGHNFEIHLNYAQVYLNSSSTYTVKIYNASNGDLITSKSTTVSGVGLQKLNLGLTYAIHEYPKLFVGLDHSGLSILRALDLDWSHFYTAVHGSISGSGEPKTGNFGSNDIGLILNYQIRCSLSNFVCQHIDSLAYAFLYCLGIEFKKEVLRSDEINQYTLKDTEYIVGEIQDFRETYMQHMDNALNGIRPQDDYYCFECAHPISKKVVLP